MTPASASIPGRGFMDTITTTGTAPAVVTSDLVPVYLVWNVRDRKVSLVDAQTDRDCAENSAVYDRRKGISAFITVAHVPMPVAPAGLPESPVMSHAAA